MHGKLASQMRRSTGMSAWTWEGWATWQAEAIRRREWRKTPIRRMLQVRKEEATQRRDRTNYHDPALFKEANGLVYGAFHFSTGKWYVGQTINTVLQRAKQHWWSRPTTRDYMHLAMADDPDPMC